MSIKIQYIIPFLTAGLLLACSSDAESPESKQGCFTFGLTSEGLVEEVQTRATHQLSDAEAADYNITLTDADGLVWSRPYADITLADRTQPLGGGYVLSAEDCTLEEAESLNEGWGCRRIAGASDSFSIVEGQTTPVTITCGMANAGLCVIFDKSFTDYFLEYAVTTDDWRVLKFNASNGAEFDNQNHLTRGTIAYYNVDNNGTHTVSVIISASAGWDGILHIQRELVLRKGGVTRLYVRKGEPNEGQVDLGITVDSEFNVEYEYIDVPVED